MRSRIHRISLVFLLAAACCGPLRADDGPKPRHDDYVAAMARTLGWLDGLTIDWLDLTLHGVKGKKKLSEILESYKILHDHSQDPEVRARIMERVGQLIEQTRMPAYHNLKVCTSRELGHSSMAYLHVASLIHDYGFDNSAYLAHVREAQPRIDEHFHQKGPNNQRGRANTASLLWGVWPLVRFGQFYDRFELAKPSILRDATLDQGAIKVRWPVRRYNDEKTYELTHEILIAFDWGRSKSQDFFSPEDLAYARKTLGALTLRYIEKGDVDVVSSLVTDLAYLGREDDPAARAGLDYILDSQNENGSWGNYEAHRRRWGKYLEAHAYLHTTLVSLRALSASFEGDWPAIGD